jgi:iron(III) transport system permease protein
MSGGAGEFREFRVGGTITMPLRIYVAVIEGAYDTAAALSSLLLAMTGVCVTVVLRLAGERPLR